MKPDFEKEASRLLLGLLIYAPGGLPYNRQFGEVFSTALLAAYAAGLERAAEIAEREEPKALRAYIADSIRAAKEADHG